MFGKPDTDLSSLAGDDKDEIIRSRMASELDRTKKPARIHLWAGSKKLGMTEFFSRPYIKCWRLFFWGVCVEVFGFKKTAF